MNSARLNISRKNSLQETSFSKNEEDDDDEHLSDGFSPSRHSVQYPSALGQDLALRESTRRLHKSLSSGSSESVKSEDKSQQDDLDDLDDIMDRRRRSNR